MTDMEIHSFCVILQIEKYNINTFPFNTCFMSLHFEHDRQLLFLVESMYSLNPSPLKCWRCQFIFGMKNVCKDNTDAKLLVNMIQYVASFPVALPEGFSLWIKCSNQLKLENG